MSSELQASAAPRQIELVPEPITAAAFAPFGTLIEPALDGKPFGPDEARLELARGTPRFYVMRLAWREHAFDHITRHLSVTQCLASCGGQPWWLAVAPPDDPANVAGRPDPAHIRAFIVPGTMAVSLHRSTWHAGPFFDAPTQDFFNLELADTNQVDHHSCHLGRSFGVTFRFRR